ncbi:SH3 domain-containing protein 19 isoform X2 [Arapaima gigas]
MHPTNFLEKEGFEDHDTLTAWSLHFLGGCSAGNKPDHRLSSQGALSSFRAAIRRSPRTSCSSTSRDRGLHRRPEITVLSAEPLSSSPWFAGASAALLPPSPPCQPILCSQLSVAAQHPPSYEQVIREKRVEQDISCAIGPRCAVTKTTATQTDIILDNNTPIPEYEATSLAPEKIKSAAEKTPKPLCLPEAHILLQQTTDYTESHFIQQLTDTDTSNHSVVAAQGCTTSSLDSVDNNLLSETKQLSASEPCQPSSIPVEGLVDPKNCSVGADQSHAKSSLDSISNPFLSNTEPPSASTEPCSPWSDSVQGPTRDSAILASDSGPPQGTRPTPRPRTKPNLQLITREVKVQTLVRLKDDGDSALVIPYTAEVSSSKYLSDLLGVFGEGQPCQSNLGNNSCESDECKYNCENSMSTLHSHRDIRAKIQAFESQASMNGGDGQPFTKPEPSPRIRQWNPPAVPTKPDVVPKPSRWSFSEKASAPSPAPKPQLPPRSTGVENGVASISSSMKAPPLPSRTSVLAQANSLMVQGDQSVARRLPPSVQRRPSLDQSSLTNYATQSLLPAQSVSGLDDEETVTSSIPTKPFSAVQNVPNRPSVSRKPTMIRVPSKPGLGEFMDTLPVQGPIGELAPPVTRKSSVTSKPTYQSELQDSSGPEMLSSSTPALSLPPRSMGGKVLPPRPPTVKVGPGRPPPPQIGGPNCYSFQNEISVSTSRQHQGQRVSKKGPVLPPRPNPRHVLYNKYTLMVPHGIAEFDYNGSNSGELSFQKNEVLLLLGQIDNNNFECQVGDTRGRVQKSYMKIITPLFDAFSDSELKVREGEQWCRRHVGGRTRIHFPIGSTEGPEELALRVGDTVSNVEEVDSEWYRGTCRGHTGFFPRNYVKVLSTVSTPPPNERRWQPGPSAVSGPRCVAQFDFEAKHSDELTFSEGDVIQLKEYVDEEWARGELAGHTGIFPLNFVDIVEDLPAPPVQQSPQTKIALPGMTSKNQEKNSQSGPVNGEWAVALYDFTAETDQDLPLRQGDHVLVTERVDGDWYSGKLHGREGLFPAAFVEFRTGEAGDKGGQLQNCKGLNVTADQCCLPALTSEEGPQRGKALYDFTSTCEEELSMKVGDILTGLESVDHEWFVGELRGHRGLVPKSYVQLL